MVEKLEKKFSKGVTLALAAAALFATLGYAADSTPKTDAVSKVHCAGINSCRGHSECHTPKNLCAGLNACKGQGWLTTTQQECQAKGGKTLTTK